MCPLWESLRTVEDFVLRISYFCFRVCRPSSIICLLSYIFYPLHAVRYPLYETRYASRFTRYEFVLYKCKGFSTNQPFFTKQTQFPKKSNERNLFLIKNYEQLTMNNEPTKTNPIKPNFKGKKNLFGSPKYLTTTNMHANLKKCMAFRLLLERTLFGR
jgi:hypothetical protein